MAYLKNTLPKTKIFFKSHKDNFRTDRCNSTTHPFIHPDWNDVKLREEKKFGNATLVKLTKDSISILSICLNHASNKRFDLGWVFFAHWSLLSLWLLWQQTVQQTISFAWKHHFGPLLAFLYPNNANYDFGILVVLPRLIEMWRLVAGLFQVNTFIGAFSQNRHHFYLISCSGQNLVTSPF